MLCRKTVDVNAEIYLTNCDGFLSSQQETLTKDVIAGLVIATIVDIFVAVFITRGNTKPINRIISGLNDASAQANSASGQVSS
jgi:hypothetical protein